MSAGATELLDQAADHIANGDLDSAEAALAAARLLDATGSDDATRPVQAYLAATTGAVLRARGHLADAERTLRAALPLVEQTPAAAEAVALLNELAVTLKFTGGFAEAELLYARALATATALVGEDHPDLAALHHNIGGLAHARGDHRAAEAHARRAVQLRTRALGPEHPAVAADEAALGAILDGLGRTEEAQALLEHALVVAERTWGANHPEVAAVLHNLASIEARRGDTDTAVALYHRVLAIGRTALGTRHPDLAVTLHNLALVLQPRDADTARSLWREAVDLLHGQVEPDHPVLMLCREELGSQ